MFLDEICRPSYFLGSFSNAWADLSFCRICRFCSRNDLFSSSLNSNARICALMFDRVFIAIRNDLKRNKVVALVVK